MSSRRSLGKSRSTFQRCGSNPMAIPIQNTIVSQGQVKKTWKNCRYSIYWRQTDFEGPKDVIKENKGTWVQTTILRHQKNFMKEDEENVSAHDCYRNWRVTLQQASLSPEPTPNSILQEHQESGWLDPLPNWVHLSMSHALRATLIHRIRHSACATLCCPDSSTVVWCFASELLWVATHEKKIR